MFVESFEDREIDERLPAVALKLPKSPAEIALCGALYIQFVRLEAPKQRLQHRPLARSDRAVIDEPSRARGGEGHREPFSFDQCARRFILGKTGHSGDVDVKVIDVGAARWRIGAEVQRFGGKQRVEGVDAERHRGVGPGSAGKPCKVGEVAHCPILSAAQAIELARQAPVAGTRTKLGREVTASRGNDEAEPRCNTAGVELKPVITKRQPRWQCHGDPLYLSAGGCCQSTGALLPAFEAAHPGDFSTAIW